MALLPIAIFHHNCSIRDSAEAQRSSQQVILIELRTDEIVEGVIGLIGESPAVLLVICV